VGRHRLATLLQCVHRFMGQQPIEFMPGQTVRFGSQVNVGSQGVRSCANALCGIV
jgi:hypothetical protein